MAALDYSRTASAGTGSIRVFGLVSMAVRSFIHWNEARQTRRVLSALTDRELEDIGLVRGDIDAVK